MAQMKRGIRTGALAVMVTAAYGCSTLESVLPDKRPDYRTAKPVETLEVPPDLTASNLDDSLVVPEFSPSSTATLSDYSSERAGGRVAPAAGGVLPDQEGIAVLRDGDKSWLRVAGSAEAVWPRIREFWLQNGFLLQKDDARIGIMETGWAENRADIADDPIRRVLGKVLNPLYSASTRDKFRVRVEKGEQPGTTEVFITHRGVEEVIQGAPDEETNSVWRPRPNDPELEVEMLKRLMVHLGVEEKRADAVAAAPQPVPERARWYKNEDGVSLIVLDDISRAWRRAGVALDRSGFAVEDRDRSKGIYFVRYIDPDREAKKGGWLSKLGFGDDDEAQQNQYQIKLSAEGGDTRVTVRNDKGELDNSRTAERILNLMYEQLK